MGRVHWTYEKCFDLAKTCQSKSEFIAKSESAYHAARRNNWMCNYYWFVDMRGAKPKDGLFYECRAIALQCNTLSEFIKKSKSAYTSSYRNGWISMFTWLKRSDRKFTKKCDNVYAYFFDDFNSVYVGRTINPTSRENSHKTDKNSTVNKFAVSHNIEIPKMVILESNITVEEGLLKEDYYIKRYRENGWNILNIGKTGMLSGSIGSMITKWTKRRCTIEAKKYTTLKDFRKYNCNAYSASKRYGFLKGFTWLKRHKRVVF